MRWYTSDTHFSHARIIELSNRPFKDVDHMNEEIIRRWNAVVSPEDEVFHLGDVALGSIADSLPLVGRLNGYKTLVIGNHDRIFAGNKHTYQQRFIPEYNRWFDDYYDNITGLSLSNGDLVNLSHFPYNGDSHDGDRFEDQRLVDNGRVLIHGHTHAEFESKGDDARVSHSDKGTLQIHVGCDAWDYTPVSEDQVISLIKQSTL